MNYYFMSLLAICTVYAFIAGGAPERIGTALYALAVVATHEILATHIGRRWLQVEFGVFVVDVILFVAFCVLAARANRFWPIWVSALLGLGVLGHMARWVGPSVLWYAYVVVLTIWSYPILAIMAIGTYNHRQRLKKLGSDPSWVGGEPPGPPSPAS